MIVTRFAPSPTGYLHLGHLHSALLGQLTAERSAGRFLLRIEDIDPARCQPPFEQAIIDDLPWAGLSWSGDIRRQSDHLPFAPAGLRRPPEKGLFYPSFCTGKGIAPAASAPPDP